MMTYKEEGHLAEKHENVKGAEGHHSHLKKEFTHEVTQAKQSCLCLVSNDLHGMTMGFTVLDGVEPMRVQY